MADNNSDSRTNLQESIKDQHKQGSLHPADLDMLMDSVSGKGYGQKRLNPAEQSSLSKKPAEEPEQRSLTGEKESRQIRGYINIVPMVITFALGILVSLLIFRMFSASPQSTKESIETSTKAETEELAVSTAENTQEQETVLPEDVPIEEASVDDERIVDQDAIVEIPDPVLKKAIQDALGIEDGEITRADALSLTKLEYDGYDWEKGESKDAVEDLSGLSAFTNLTELSLPDNQLTEISELSGLTNLTLLWLDNNQLSDISALSGLTNLMSLSLDYNQLSDISVLSGLTNLTTLSLVYNQLSDISALSGLTNLMYLDLKFNDLTDISALSGLTNLTGLYLHKNQISDISALSGLTNLKTLRLYDNPVLENKSGEEIMEVLSGAEDLTDTDF